jgi:hypothetical protein
MEVHANAPLSPIGRPRPTNVALCDTNVGLELGRPRSTKRSPHGPPAALRTASLPSQCFIQANSSAERTATPSAWPDHHDA